MKKLILLTFSLLFLVGCGNSDFSNHSTSYIPEYYGSEVMLACRVDSGNCYNLDVHREGGEIKRIYFPEKGSLNYKGYVDITSTYVEDSIFYAIDSNGNQWELEF